MNETESGGALVAAAFGSEPDRWPLPAAGTPYQLWLRAVVAGGQGRFASARTDLAALLRGRPAGPLASLAHSVQGSFLRQLGWHPLARRWDGRAAALAGDDPEALADALIGLAADMLGVGRYAASATLLSRAATVQEPTSTLPHRSAVRQAWVSAELAMATGDGAGAVRHAERAAELSGSARHRLKSDVVLAAALCCAGRTDRARAVADAALDNAEDLGLIPLRWAAACLLADIGSTLRTAQQICEIRDGCAALVHRRGGDWRT